MRALALDPAKTEIKIFTYAEGLLARLAHDLEMRATGAHGTADDEAKTAELVVPVSGIEVRGSVKKGITDRSALSAEDRADIERKTSEEIFHVEPGAARDAVIRVAATLTGARARYRVTTPNGREASAEGSVELETHGESRLARGSCDLSLAALGAGAVKGPLGAFRLKDRVHVTFSVAFGPAPASPNQPA